MGLFLIRLILFLPILLFCVLLFRKSKRVKIKEPSRFSKIIWNIAIGFFLVLSCVLILKLRFGLHLESKYLHWIIVFLTPSLTLIAHFQNYPVKSFRSIVLSIINLGVMLTLVVMALFPILILVFIGVFGHLPGKAHFEDEQVKVCDYGLGFSACNAPDFYIKRAAIFLEEVEQSDCPCDMDSSYRIYKEGSKYSLEVDNGELCAKSIEIMN